MAALPRKTTSRIKTAPRSVSKTSRRTTKASQFQHDFLINWFRHAKNLPAPIPEYKGIPGRDYQFDFAWPFKFGGGIMVELEGIMGGSFKSRHTTIVGYSEDCAKYNLATTNDWKILRYTQLLTKGDEAWEFCIQQIARLVRIEEEDTFDARCKILEDHENPYETWCNLWVYPKPTVKEKKPKDTSKPVRTTSTNNKKTNVVKQRRKSNDPNKQSNSS